MKPARTIVFAFALTLAAAGTAAAQPTPAQSNAQSLYQEAVALFKAGDVHAACSKLDESYKLEAATQTLYALAKCRQREGRLATAYVQFQELEKRAQREGDAAKASDVRTRLKEIEPKLSQAILKLESHPEVGEVKIDGRSVPRTEWASPILLDTGAHTFVFSGAGKADLEKTIELKEGETITFQIDPLRDATSPPATPDRNEHVVSSDGMSNKTIGYILGGAGVASIVVGSIFGIVALDKKSTADDLFAKRDPSFKDADDSASTAALVSTIGFGAGIALLGAGAYFVFFAGDKKSTTGTIHMRGGAIAF